MRNVYLFLLLGVGFAFSFTLISHDIGPLEGKEITKSTVERVLLSGTINISVDGTPEISHSVSGTAGVCTYIRKLYVDNNNAEGTYSVSGSNVTVKGVEDSSPHEIRVDYIPLYNNFVIDIDVNTSTSATKWGVDCNGY
ncbi:hypothetical protein [Membranihabitans maritimus]|uniref:hypothetical protein n=1 Tax=Membranihabitans maritimus TaxID=2904244 RepID=UPI001F337F3C|nr:hypothetical protein [Membranihabitans maritimus]